MFIGENRTHDCYKHYKLKTNPKFFTCDGCKMNGFGPRYVCELCDNEMHKPCRYPANAIITHEFFGCSDFEFVKTPSIILRENKSQELTTYSCNACGEEIRGFSYYCLAKDLVLHPMRYRLEKKVLIDDVIFDLTDKGPTSKCEWCEDEEITDEGWSYVSTCDKHQFHVYCLTEMVHESLTKNGGQITLSKFEKTCDKYLNT